MLQADATGHAFDADQQVIDVGRSCLFLVLDGDGAVVLVQDDLERVVPRVARCCGGPERYIDVRDDRAVQQVMEPALAQVAVAGEGEVGHHRRDVVVHSTGQRYRGERRCDVARVESDVPVAADPHVLPPVPVIGVVRFHGVGPHDVVVAQAEDGLSRPGDVDPFVHRSVGLVAIFPDIAVGVRATGGGEGSGGEDGEKEEGNGSEHDGCACSHKVSG